jgi:hypothetical protein
VAKKIFGQIEETVYRMACLKKDRFTVFPSLQYLKNDVHDLIDSYRWLTLHEIDGNCGISKTVVTVHRYLSLYLNMSQGCVLWVRRILTNENLVKRVGYSQGSLLTKLTKVAHLTSGSVKDCSAYEFMPILYAIQL